MQENSVFGSSNAAWVLWPGHQLKRKKGGEVSTFFAPNLTMNLTYLCYGVPKVSESLSEALFIR